MSLPPANQPNGTTQLLGMFASALRFLQDHTMAGDEVSGKQVDEFLRELGVPETPVGKNALLAFANATAVTAPDEIEGAAPPADGPVAANFDACRKLRRLLDGGLPSISDTRKAQLREESGLVLDTLTRLLKAAPYALKLLSTMAGLGIIGFAGWLIWSASEKDWKIGTWGVLVIGALRLLGNLIYNAAAVVRQSGSMVYIHVGLGSVGYLVEILTRFGVTIPNGTTTTVATVLASFVPLFGLYLGEIRSARRMLAAKREHKRSGPASADDIEALRPIVDAFQAYVSKSKSLTARGTMIKAGNRTAAVAKIAQTETQQLLDLLNLDVSPQATRCWKDLLTSLLKEAAKKSPSIIYALFTGIFLFTAALGNVKATADVSTLAILLSIETIRGVADTNLAPNEMAYRILLLTLGRFGSIFFFAAPLINDRSHTGRTDLFQRDPDLAVLMAHLNAVFITIFGIYVIPTIELLPRFISWGYGKARRVFA